MEVTEKEQVEFLLGEGAYDMYQAFQKKTLNMWHGGKCPIPHLKAGQFKVFFRNLTSSTLRDAIDYTWEHNGYNHDIIAWEVL